MFVLGQSQTLQSYILTFPRFGVIQSQGMDSAFLGRGAHVWPVALPCLCHLLSSPPSTTQRCSCSEFGGVFLCFPAWQWLSSWAKDPGTEERCGQGQAQYLEDLCDNFLPMVSQERGPAQNQPDHCVVPLPCKSGEILQRKIPTCCSLIPTCISRNLFHLPCTLSGVTRLGSRGE